MLRQEVLTQANNRKRVFLHTLRVQLIFNVIKYGIHHRNEKASRSPKRPLGLLFILWALSHIFQTFPR